MRRSDVLRGCAFAYGTGAGLGSILVYLALVLSDEADLFGIPVLVIVVGAVLAVPFSLLALAVHHTLARRQIPILWYAPLLTLLGIVIILASPFIREFGLSQTLASCIVLATCVGLGFWLGAAGWRRSVMPTLGPEGPNPLTHRAQGDR